MAKAQEIRGLAEIWFNSKKSKKMQIVLKMRLKIKV